MTDTTELTVLKMLAARRRVQFVATACSLMPVQVLDIARRHGILLANGEVDYTAAGHAAAEVLQANGTSLPVRDPAPVRPRPAAPVRVSPADVTIAEDQLLTLPIGQVHPDPDNPRDELPDIPELAESLKAVGMLQPIVVRRAAGRWVVVMGHRRLAAARVAGWSSVRVIVRGAMRPDDVLAAMLVENGHRRDLDPIEEARGLARLKAQLGGVSDSAVAARVGRPPSHVIARLRLLALPIEEQDEVRRGEMTLAAAAGRAKVASGRIGTGPTRGLPHLSTAHPLAENAKARCRRLGHSRGKGQGVGGLACGACWESVIRADERRHLHAHSARTGTCVVCDAPIDTPAAPTPLREANSA